jgi:hypothetical protein
LPQKGTENTKRKMMDISGVIRPSLILCLFVAIKFPMKNGVADFDCHKKAQKTQKGNDGYERCLSVFPDFALFVPLCGHQVSREKWRC